MSATGATGLDAGTRMAIDRTRLAHERTLMAWVRTATSLISFGFTIYKFFQLEIKNEAANRSHLFGPREFALAMIAIGLVALMLSTVQHRRDMQAMRAEFGRVPYSTAAVVAGLISALGIVAFVAVVMHG